MVSPATLTFTPANWNMPQTVTVTGVSDTVVDGDQTTQLTVAVDVAASHPLFANVASQTITVTTLDAGSIFIRLPGGDTLWVAEFGSVAQRQGSFSVALTSPPASDVVLRLSSGNTAELIVSTTSLTFTPVNWDVPQSVTLQGANDNVSDGDQLVLVTLSVDTAVSDPAYAAAPQRQVPVLVRDVPVAPLITAPSGMTSNPVSIEFSSTDGATSYNLWFVNLDTGLLVESRTDIPAASTSVALDNSVLPPGIYRAYVSANNDYGFSNWALRDFGVDVAAVPPATPTISGVQATANPQRPELNWNASAGAIRYSVWLVRLSDGTLVESTPVVTNSFTPTSDLDPGRYRLLVRGANGIGSSPWSAPFDFDVGAPITRPAAPVITGTSASGNPLAPQVNWNASSGATYYVTWLVDLTSGALVSPVQVPEASFTPESDLAAGRYRILVRSGNSAGLSPWECTAGLQRELTDHGAAGSTGSLGHRQRHAAADVAVAGSGGSQ